MKLVPEIMMPSWFARFKPNILKCEVCRHSSGLLSGNATRQGIKMKERWYCSARCFRFAVEREAARLLKLKIEQPLNGSRMPLGLSLVRHELLTIEQLRKATEELREAGGELGEMLVRQGAVSEKQVTAIRAELWGCPVFSVSSYASEVPVDLPPTLMREYSMSPVHYVTSTNLLLVGFVHSVEYGLLYSIEQMTGCSTKPCFVTRSDYQLQIEKQEGWQMREGRACGSEVHVEIKQTALEIATTLCKAGLEMEADQALLERCKDYLWARLQSVSCHVDLVFKAG